MKDFEKCLKAAEGNIMHEGLFLNDEERELIRLRAEIKISQEEFVKRTIEYHTENYMDIERCMKEIGS